MDLDSQRLKKRQHDDADAEQQSTQQGTQGEISKRRKQVEVPQRVEKPSTRPVVYRKRAIPKPSRRRGIAMPDEDAAAPEPAPVSGKRKQSDLDDAEDATIPDLPLEEGWITPAMYRRLKRRREWKSPEVKKSALSTSSKENIEGKEATASTKQDVKDEVGNEKGENVPPPPVPILAPVSTPSGRIKLSVSSTTHDPERSPFMKAPTPLVKKPLSDDVVEDLVQKKIEQLQNSPAGLTKIELDKKKRVTWGGIEVSVAFDANATLSEAPLGGLPFGSGTLTSKPLEIPSLSFAKAEVTTAPALPTFGASETKTEVGTTQAPAPFSGFNLGKPAETNTATPGVSFLPSEAKPTTTTEKTDGKAPAPFTFNFGGSQPASVTTKPAESPAQPAPASTGITIPSFGAGPISFGTNSGATGASGATGTGAPSTTTMSNEQAKAPLFSFGTQSQQKDTKTETGQTTASGTASPAPISFGGLGSNPMSSTTLPSSASNGSGFSLPTQPTISFGAPSPAPAASTTPAATSIPSFTFGAQPANTSTAPTSATPTFNVGAPATTAPAGSGLGASKPFNFGSSAPSTASTPFGNQSQPAPSLPTFGANPTGGFGIVGAGSTQPTAPATQPTFSFGSSSFGQNQTAAPSAGMSGAQGAPSLNFGGAPTSTGFSFGAGTSASQPSATGFGFGQNQAAAAPAQAPSFTFGGNANAGAPQAAPSFGAPAPSAGGFNFGAQNTAPQAGGGSTMFSFGAQQPSQPSQPAFQFGAGGGAPSFGGAASGSGGSPAPFQFGAGSTGGGGSSGSLFNPGSTGEQRKLAQPKARSNRRPTPGARR
ncbi:hypothetical protein HDU96_005361 [Phlyctochytrium bullatum]|nr:hypothetical protein HDU96_005361 [Phlyctochytrium bullatum]